MRRELLWIVLEMMQTLGFCGHRRETESLAPSIDARNEEGSIVDDLNEEDGAGDDDAEGEGPDIQESDRWSPTGSFVRWLQEDSLLKDYPRQNPTPNTVHRCQRSTRARKVEIPKLRFPCQSGRCTQRLILEDKQHDLLESVQIKA